MSELVSVEVPLPLETDVSLPIAITDVRLDTPAVLVDLDIAEDNITRMAQYASDSGVVLRPHTKTHKSAVMAKRQLDAGAIGLTVATSSEAQVLGVNTQAEILIAYPLVGVRKLSRIAALVKEGRVVLTADSLACIDRYEDFANSLSRSIPVVVEVDTGTNRSGVVPAGVIEMCTYISTREHLDFRGLMTHANHAHQATDAQKMKDVALSEASIMGSLRSDLEGLGFSDFMVSAGSSLTTQFLNASQGITEVRPGTYIYNDLRTFEHWSCELSQIAATCLATVSSSNRDRVTLDSGNKTVTVSTLKDGSFGRLRDYPDYSLRRLSEEHGVIDAPGVGEVLSIGQRVDVLPVHVCVWMDLQAQVYGTRGGQIVERIDVQGMRHSL